MPSLRIIPALCAVLLATTAACGDDAPVPATLEPFPEHFLWGTAIAPYQVEGGLTGTDWYQWETACEHCSGDSAQDGPDFWNRYEEDLDNAASISNNAIRIGIDWSRVFPTEESFPFSPDPVAVARYHAMLSAARQRGLEPMVTLVHFVLPTWLQDLDDLDNRRGWEDEAIVGRFGEFAAWAGAEFGDQVDLWITLNEPFVNLTGGWISGDVPPGKSFEIDLALVAGKNMVYAHARAYDALHAMDTVDADGDGEAARVSISKHNRVFLPKDESDEKQVRATRMLRYLLNDYFLEAVVNGNIDENFDFDFDDLEDTADDERIKNRLDYIGLNYYGVTLIIDTANDDNFPLIGLPLINDLDRQGFAAPLSDFGWSLYAPGFRTVIDEIARYELPIIITENGVADAADAQRPRFLVEHLYEIQRAIGDGIDVQGYFHWSLMDNFEWGSGYCPRFGLFHIDFDDPDKPRTAGAGAEMYRRIIDAGTVDPLLYLQVDYGQPGYCTRVGF